MHANASRLVLVVLLIGWKSGANFSSQSCSVESVKPITFRYSIENRSILPKWLFDRILVHLKTHQPLALSGEASNPEVRLSSGYVLFPPSRITALQILIPPGKPAEADVYFLFLIRCIKRESQKTWNLRHLYKPKSGDKVLDQGNMPSVCKFFFFPDQANILRNRLFLITRLCLRMAGCHQRWSLVKMCPI